MSRHHPPPTTTAATTPPQTRGRAGAGCRAPARRRDPRPRRHRPDGPRGARRPAPPRCHRPRPRPRPRPGSPRSRASRSSSATCATRASFAPRWRACRRSSTSPRTRPTRSSSPARSSPPVRMPARGSSSPGSTSRPSNPVFGWLLRRFYGLVLPRYRGKFAIGRMVEASATNPVIISPSNFMQNDEVLIDVIRGGEFVHPCSPKGLNRVDLRDVGEAAATILLDPSTPSGTYGLVGPRSLTGPECAQVWAEALDRPVRYAGEDDAALDAALTAHLTGYRLDDWSSSLRKLRKFAVHATAEELATTERLLGRAPTDYTEFVRRVVAEHAPVAPSDGRGRQRAGASPGIRSRVRKWSPRQPRPHSRPSRGAGRSEGCPPPRSRLGAEPFPHPQHPGVRRGQHRSRRRPRDPRLARQPHRRGRGRPRRRDARACGGPQRRVDRGLRGRRAP